MPTTRSCPVCGVQRAKLLFHPIHSPGPIALCKGCGMVYVSEVEDAHALIFEGPVMYDGMTPELLKSSRLEDVKDSWEFDELSDKESQEPALRKNALQALKHIERYTEKPLGELKLLDFGSGFGFFLSVAKRKGWVTVGIEPLPASSIYARARFGLEIITDTLRDDTLPPVSLDVVTSFQVFEHLPVPDKNLSQLHRFIKPGGIILIEVPRYDTWTMKLLRSRHRHFVQDHLNFFTCDTLKMLLVQRGFEIVDLYCPPRAMSIQHLYQYWIRNKLRESGARIFSDFLEHTGIRDKTIDVNLGDILTVIARKTT